MLAPMLDQLNPKLGASNVRAGSLMLIKVSETKQTFAGKMVSVKVDLCTSRKRHFIGINLQVVVDGNLRLITAAVNELRLVSIRCKLHAWCGKFFVSCASL